MQHRALHVLTKRWHRKTWTERRDTRAQGSAGVTSEDECELAKNEAAE